MRHPAFTYIALVFLLFLQAGDLHSHFCLDGQEPTVSLHYENLNGHPEHEQDETAHDDIENEINTTLLLIKDKQAGIDTAVNAQVNIFFTLAKATRPVTTRSASDLPTAPAVTLPPLRAPPVNA